jgi:hypothetical protein
VVLSLVPVLAAGLAIQQLIELLDPVTTKVIGDKDKKMVLSIISLAAGLVLSFGCGLRVLAPLGVINGDVLDGIITALIVSAGTETINSLLKYLGYAKENMKVEATGGKVTTKKDYSANTVTHKVDRNTLRL